jgi:hypothetical protein
MQAPPPHIAGILQALRRGGLPMGNTGKPGNQMPQLQGLGAMQQWLQQADVPQALGTSAIGQNTANLK